MDNVYACTGHDLKIPDVSRAEGIYIYTTAGKRYMDLESGVWCLSLGHGHERINSVIRNQTDALMHAGFCYSHPVVDEAAKAVLRITGLDGGRCVFLCSGSEGIEVSRQIARHLTGNRTSLTLHDSYLGAYSSVRDRENGWHLFDWSLCGECPDREECDPECRSFEDIPLNISDFIFEPGSASGFVRFPPKAVIRNIAAIVRRNRGKIIANEVTTGVGRTGRWFGYNHYGIEPDMVALGKGIGNGYPVSAAALSGRTIAELDEKPFKYAQSHQNDPLGAAVVKKVIEVIEEEDLIAGAARKGNILASDLERLAGESTGAVVRGRGLMFALDLADTAVTNRIYEGLLGRGYIVGNRGTALRIDPPLIATKRELAEFIEALGKILDAG